MKKLFPFLRLQVGILFFARSHRQMFFALGPLIILTFLSLNHFFSGYPNSSHPGNEAKEKVYQTVAPLDDFNLAPTAMDFTAANGPFEDLSYLFTTDMFGYADNDGDPLSYLEINALPAYGILYLDGDNDDTYDAGEEVVLNDQILKADLDGGKLQYVQFGSENTSFSYVVNDGSDNSLTDYTATLNLIPVPTVTLSLNNPGAAEELTATATLTATLSNAYALNTEVNLAFTGTATEGDDYSRSGAVITIPGGHTSGDITLHIADDHLFEGGDETIIIDIQSVSNGKEDGMQQATHTISEAEIAPLVSLTQSTDTIGHEDGGFVYITAGISQAAAVPVTIDLDFSGTAAGAGTDYTAASGSMIIHPGDTKDSIQITSVMDALEEGDESIVIDVNTVTNGMENGNQQVTILIIDEDARPEIRITNANGVEIASADVSPSALDSTDFGTIVVDGGREENTFIIENIGFADLHLSGTPRVSLVGSEAFSVDEQPALGTVAHGGGSTVFTITFDPSSDNCTGPLTATVSIMNDDENEHPYTFVVQGYPRDNVDPITRCMDTTVYLDQTGYATITPSFVDNASADNCAIQSLVLDIDTFTCSEIGSNLITLTATDAQLNEGNCQATVHVLDTVSPDANCVPEFTLSLAGDGLESIHPDSIDLGSFDHCGIEQRILDITTFYLADLGMVHPVTMTVADSSGNESTCTTNISLELPAPEAAEPSLRQRITESNLEETNQPPSIFDPCTCRNNTDSLSNGTFTNKGLFDDEIVVMSATIGDEWIIYSTGDQRPLPYAYVANPDAQIADLTPVSIGDTLDYVGSMMVEGEIKYLYSLPVIHRDSLGYSVRVVESNNKYPGDTLFMANTCYYPDIYFDDLATGYLQSSDPITITGSILNAAQATGAFILNGDTLAQGDLPLELTLDFSTVEAGPTELIFVADSDTAGMEDLNDPGCRQKVFEPFIVSDGNFACNGQVNVNLSRQCEVELALSQLMRGRYVSSVAYLYEVSMAMDGNLLEDNIIRQPGLYDYRIDGPDGFVCWGRILAEDKFPPEIKSVNFTQDTLFCTDLDAIWDNPSTIDPGSEFYTGSVVFQDACAADPAPVSFADRVEFGQCEDGYTAKLFRTFSARGPEGQSTDTTQVITFIVPPLDSLIRIDEPVLVQTCDADARRTPQVWPFWINSIGDTIFLNEVECGYGLAVDSTVFSICGNEGRKIERFIRVFDWCGERTEIVDTIILQIGDFAPPEYTGKALPYDRGLIDASDPENPRVIVDRDSLLALHTLGKITTLSTGPTDCTASFSTQLDPLKNQFEFDIQDCEVSDYSLSIWHYGPRINHDFPLGDTTWRETNYPIINGVALGLPIGIYALVIETFDGCFNHSKGIAFFTVKDRIAPTPVCDDNLQVTLSNAGYAQVYAADIDEGTTDNCSLNGIQVRRSVAESCVNAGFFTTEELILEDGVYYSHWNDFIELYCCDLLHPPRVELRGTDQAVDPLTGQSMPNQSICWMTLQLDDKLQPTCSDLPEVTTYCQDPQLEDLSLFGTPVIPPGTCNNFETLELDALYDLDQCGFGTITRQYQTVKNGGSEQEERSDLCTQVISVAPTHRYWVSFPADQTANCGMETDIVGVTFSENACDLIAVSQNDEIFTATADPNACYKIFRTYQVINWCEYNGEAQPTVVSRDWDGWNATNPQQPDGDDQPGDEPIFVHVMINLADNVPDTVYYDNNDQPYDKSVVVGDDAYGYWWRVISGTANPAEEAYFEGNGSVWSDDGNQNDNDISGNQQGDDTDYRYGSFGFFQYTQHIIVYDDVDPDLSVAIQDTFCSISNEDCSGAVSFTVEATDLCTSDVDDVTIRVEWDAFNDGVLDADVTHLLTGNQFSGRYPLGEHRFRVTADDGCGNAVQQEFLFTVVDCKAPAPIVIDALSVELTRDELDSTGASALVWASDYIASPIFDCSGQGMDGEVLQFSINRKGDRPDSSQTSLYLNCIDAVQTIEIEIHAWDLAGNHDFTSAYLLVQDNNGACDQGAGEGQISGSIVNEAGVPVNEVEVTLSGKNPATFMTNATGTFAFSDLPEGLDFSVIPRKNIFHGNGVSTFDLILMQKQILGIKPLTSPYQWIAADINNSKSITTLDLIQLRKVILNIEDEFTNNTSWRFVDADYYFPSAENALQAGFPEVKNINNLEGEEVADFVAIKIGDVNGSAMAYVQPRSNQPYLISCQAADRLSAGEESIITFSKSDPQDISGLQFTVAWDPGALEVVDFIPQLISDGEVGWFADEGFLTFSWIAAFVKEEKYATSDFFELRVKAKRDLADLTPLISVSNRYTVSEAYRLETNEIMPVVLNWRGMPHPSEPQLMQNQPNPFSWGTYIRFSLPQATSAKLLVKDASGRILKTYQENFPAGNHQIHLSPEVLSGSGIYYYTLETSHHTITKRMMFLR